MVDIRERMKSAYTMRTTRAPASDVLMGAHRQPGVAYAVDEEVILASRSADG
jgi:hypothetical protein